MKTHKSCEKKYIIMELTKIIYFIVKSIKTLDSNIDYLDELEE